MVTLKPDFLRGSYPPLITPFSAGKVDFKKFRELAKRQLSSGSHGILVTGTTGEPSSLTIDERSELLEVALEAVGGRIPVVAATGSQSLAETLELTTRAEKAGASAALVVTPYYIKPSQRGLIEYFRAVGHATQLPLMMYHIPGRAAVSVKLQTLVAISQLLPHFVGIKHATADLELVTEIRASLGPEFRIFSGVEALSLPMLLVGASGLMNAVGNLAPDRVAALYNAVATRRSQDRSRAPLFFVRAQPINLPGYQPHSAEVYDEPSRLAGSAGTSSAPGAHRWSKCAHTGWRVTPRGIAAILRITNFHAWDKLAYRSLPFGFLSPVIEETL